MNPEFPVGSESSSVSQSQSEKMPILQMSFLGIILLVCIWITFGRASIGFGGWLVLVHLFTLIPVLIVYGVIVQAIGAIRYKRSGYTFGRWMKGAICTMVTLSVVYGLTIVDGGDTPESVGSVVTKIFGATSDSMLGGLSAVVGEWSFYLLLTSLVAILLLVIFEKRDSLRV